MSEQEIAQAIDAAVDAAHHTKAGGYIGGNETGKIVAAVRAVLPILRPEGSELYCRCGNPWPKTPCGTACHARPK